MTMAETDEGEMEFVAVGHYWCLTHKWDSNRRNYCPSEMDTDCEMVPLGYMQPKVES